jgi:hypothetical protein
VSSVVALVEAPTRIDIMSKVKDFKRRADSVLEELFRSVFEEIDVDKIRKEVDDLRRSEPDYNEVQYARKLSRRTAIRCAAAGAVTGLPMGLAAIGTLGADLAYLMYQQFRLILGIATIYGHDPSARERFGDALSCLAYTTGIGVGKHGIATMLGAVEGAAVVEKIGARALREQLAKMVPIVGIFSGGALNYAAVRAVGRSAIRYYEARVDEGLANEIWAEGDREHA